MATRPRQIGDSVQAQLLHQISKQLDRLIKVTAAGGTTTSTTTTTTTTTTTSTTTTTP